MDDSTRDSLPPAFDLGIAGFDGAVAVGRGGFSIVYRAREVALERDVAIKVLQGSPDEGEWRAFERERRALGVLSQHPNVVTVFATGFTDDHQPYLLMEYMPGGSLSERIAREALPWPEAAEITIKVAGALQAAHDAGVLHRDIKPGNVLMSGYGEPKLADFGIARIEGGADTRTGVVSATIEHAAPEVLAGQRPTTVADVYSLGSTLYALLSGRAPFTRDTDESIAPLLARIATAPVPDLTASGIPVAICRVLEDALAKDPAERIQTAAELARRLDAARTTGDDHRPPAALPRATVPADGHDPHRKRRRRRVVVAAIAAVVLAAGAVTVVVTRSHSTSNGASRASPTGYVPRYVNTACPAQLNAGDPRVTCGELVVPENRAKPAGRKLRLLVYRAPATTTLSAPIPTISVGLDILSNQLPSPVREFVDSNVRELGEHITIAARGGSGSTPPFECPNLRATALSTFTLPTDSPDESAQLVSAAAACRDAYIKQGADLASYGSTDEALDVRDLAWALKLRSVNIEAASGDTLTALKIAAMAPGLVRAFVLEDVVPPGRYFLDGAIDNGRHAFARYAAACAAQPACKRVHPDLQASLAQLYSTLQAKPVTVPVADPTDPAKPPIPLLFDGDGIVRDAVIALRDPFAVPLLASVLDPPQLSIAAQYTATIFTAPFEVSSFLLRPCIDTASSVNRLRLQAEADAAPMYGGLQELFRFDICTAITQRLRTQPTVLPSSSPGVPTLILGGELNPDSSPQWADDTARTFGDASVVMLRNLTADPIGNGPPCVAQLRLDFLRHPRQRLHPQACIASIPPVQFAGT